LVAGPEHQLRDLGLKVEFREGYVLRGEVHALVPEDERDLEFAFGDGMVTGAISGIFDSIISSFELYALPSTSTYLKHRTQNG
jgi:hypothetical protein